MLFFGKHGHDDECVQVNPLTQHPEVVASKDVQMDELRHFTADLNKSNKNIKIIKTLRDISAFNLKKQYNHYLFTWLLLLLLKIE